MVLVLLHRELFEKRWDQEKGEWVLHDALFVGDSAYHGMCAPSAHSPGSSDSPLANIDHTLSDIWGSG